MIADTHNDTDELTQADIDAWQAERPSEAEELYAELRGAIVDRSLGPVVRRTVYIPATVSRNVEAMVTATGWTRNELISRLLRIGVEELRRVVSSDDFKRYNLADEEAYARSQTDE